LYNEHPLRLLAHLAMRLTASRRCLIGDWGRGYGVCLAIYGVLVLVLDPKEGEAGGHPTL
jgi:hypothetical protein